MSFPKAQSGLAQFISYTFKKENLLTLALTHRSYLNENKEHGEHNERLEFLGDAVLELVTTEHLYHQMPETPEGKMTSIRSALVRKENLFEVAEDIQLGEYLLLSKGEDLGGGRNNAYILANTVEALIGAIYLDTGYEAAKTFIHGFVLPKLDKILAERLYRDAKSLLQEIAQEKHKLTPSYTILSEEGPDHDKEFEAGVYVGEDMLGKGLGSSKQAAEIAAARSALKKIDE